MITICSQLDMNIHFVDFFSFKGGGGQQVLVHRYVKFPISLLSV